MLATFLNILEILKPFFFYFFICNSTNESTITINKYIKIIRLLHVLTPNVSSSRTATVLM